MQTVVFPLWNESHHLLVFFRTCRKFSCLKKLLLNLLALPFQLLAFSQTDSSHLRISLLTCTPGDELYSTFGHSAIRVKDSANGYDIIYNYGTFDFDDPDFYIKFAKGKMQYFVSQAPIGKFILEYQDDKRGITEQQLQLNSEEKFQLAAALRTNALEQNKFYLYDFLYDNCSSRLRDIVNKHVSSPLVFKTILSRPVTFRNMIHEYLDKGNQPWSKLGIDILLGSKLDILVKNEQAMFLPDYLMKGFDSASSACQPIVEKKSILLPAGATNEAGVISPFWVFSILFILVAILSISNTRGANRFFKVFDFLLFLITGLLGILLAVMWIGRIDTVCSNNYNLLWALPLNAYMAFCIIKQKAWVKKYWLAAAILQVLLILLWKWLPQQMNTALLPIVLLLLLRYVMRYKKVPA